MWPGIESINAASMQPAQCCTPDGQKYYEKMCESKTRTVWPQILSNIYGRLFTFTREYSPKVEIEECL